MARALTAWTLRQMLANAELRAWCDPSPLERLAARKQLPNLKARLKAAEKREAAAAVP